MSLERLRLGVSTMHEVRQSLAQTDTNFQLLATAEAGGAAAGKSLGFSLTLFKAVPFITDVTDADGNPTVNYESGTVPDDKVVSSVEYQSGELTVTVEGEVDGGPNGFTPTVTITGSNVSDSPVACTLSALGTNTRRYSFSQAITLTGEGDVSVETEDGAYHTVAFSEADAAPDITTLTHGTVAEHQPTQTRVKNTDTVSFSATFPAGASYFVLENFELHGTTAQEYAIDPTDTSIDDTFTVAGSNGSVHNIKAHLKLASGATGNSLESTNTGLFHDSDAPTLANVVVSNYPADQTALKDNETCDCTAALTGSQGDNGLTTDWSSILYSDNSMSELSIPSTTTYAETKTVTRIGGDYRETGEFPNYIIVVSKSYNGTHTSKWATVRIAHVLPTVTVTESASRMRSKTGAAATHTITITSNQYIFPTTPSLARDSGDDGPALSAFSGGPYIWTATLTSEEDDTKNTAATVYTWESLSAINRAGKEQTTISGDATYTIGGFEEREIAFARFEEYNAIGTMATNKDNANLIDCRVDQYGKTLTYYEDTDPHTDGYTITDSDGNFDADGDYVRVLDSNIYDAAAYNVQISEAIS